MNSYYVLWSNKHISLWLNGEKCYYFSNSSSRTSTWLCRTRLLQNIVFLSPTLDSPQNTTMDLALCILLWGSCVLTHRIYSLFPPPGMPVPLLCHDLPSIFCRPLSHLHDKVISFLSAVILHVISGLKTMPYLTPFLTSSPLVQS